MRATTHSCFPGQYEVKTQVRMAKRYSLVVVVVVGVGVVVVCVCVCACSM